MSTFRPPSEKSRKQGSTIKPSRGKRHEARDAEAAGVWREGAYLEAEGMDRIAGVPLGGTPEAPDEVQVHHWLEAHCIWDMRRTIGAKGAELIALMYEPRNRIALNKRTHERHNTWTQRITRDRVPDGVWDFARELDERSERPWAVVRLELDYPQPTKGKR